MYTTFRPAGTDEGYDRLQVELAVLVYLDDFGESAIWVMGKLTAAKSSQEDIEGAECADEAGDANALIYASDLIGEAGGREVEH